MSSARGAYAVSVTEICHAKKVAIADFSKVST